jgi:hypothetical protein
VLLLLLLLGVVRWRQLPAVRRVPAALLLMMVAAAAIPAIPMRRLLLLLLPVPVAARPPATSSSSSSTSSSRSAVRRRHWAHGRAILADGRAIPGPDLKLVRARAGGATTLLRLLRLLRLARVAAGCCAALLPRRRLVVPAVRLCRLCSCRAAAAAAATWRGIRVQQLQI